MKKNCFNLNGYFFIILIFDYGNRLDIGNNKILIKSVLYDCDNENVIELYKFLIFY